MGCSSVFARFALVSFVNCSVNISHMGHQFSRVCKWFATHWTFSCSQRPTFLKNKLWIYEKVMCISFNEHYFNRLHFFSNIFAYTNNCWKPAKMCLLSTVKAKNYNKKLLLGDIVHNLEIRTIELIPQLYRTGIET